MEKYEWQCTLCGHTEHSESESVMPTGWDTAWYEGEEITLCDPCSMSWYADENDWSGIPDDAYT